MKPDFEDLEVVDVVRETAESCSILLGVPEDQRERFAYRAGQFLTFEIPWEEFTISRCYSLSSAPEVDAVHKVTVKRVADGRMSNWINDNCKPGSRLRVSPPDGRFVLNEDAGDADLTLFGAGSGITPVISLLKSALATTGRRVTLFYANRNADSAIFGKELADLEANYSDRLRVEHHFDDVSGFWTPEQARTAISGHEAGEFYVCGPEEYMAAVETALVQAGVPLQHTHFERFVSPLDPDRDEQGVADLDAQVPESVVVKLAGRKYTVPYERGETLLAAARRAGVQAPSSCEDGFCGSCMAQLERGQVRMKANDALTQHEVDAGRVLVCQSIPVSTDPLLVDYDAASFTIADSLEQRRWPRIVGAGVFAFLAIAIWALRTAG